MPEIFDGTPKLEIILKKPEQKNRKSKYEINQSVKNCKIINVCFNNKIKFVAMEKIVMENSELFSNLREGDKLVKQFTVKLPTLDFVDLIIGYLQSGYFPEQLITHNR
eukprot:UN07077